MNKLREFLNIFNLIVAVSLTFACSKTNKVEMKIIQVPRNVDKDVNLNDIASSIETISLETREDALIINPYDLKIFEKKLFVKDRNSKIIVFDLEGNYIKNLIPIGDGPGESKTIFGFTIDDATGEIYISDARRLLVFSADGVFKAEKILKAILITWLFLAMGYMLWQNTWWGR